MKTAVITGATSGIGNSILKAFLKDGYTVYAGYRDIRQKKIFSLLSENIIPFRIDLTKKWTIEEAVKTISDSVEKIDVLVNVAGTVVAGPLETLPVDKIREQFEINVFSHLEFTQGLFEKLDGGKVINISSMASYGMFPFLAPYCASKKTLDMLFNSLRIETGSKVKIISVKPGVVATPLWEKAIEENKDNIGTGKYKVVGDFLTASAMRSSELGLNPNLVARKVVKIANEEEPKNSYVIGLDALAVQIISKLPQKLIDIIVEHQLVKRVQAQLEVTMAKENESSEKIPEEEISQDINSSEKKYYTPEKSSEEITYTAESFETPMDNMPELKTEDVTEESTEDKLQSSLEDAIESNKPRRKRKNKNKKADL